VDRHPARGAGLRRHHRHRRHGDARAVGRGGVLRPGLECCRVDRRRNDAAALRGSGGCRQRRRVGRRGGA
jgi:hypothetical protein